MNENKIKWPESVPVLTARDICRDLFDGPHGTHCLIGWERTLPEGCRDAVRQALQEEAGTEYIARNLNDNRKISKARIAAVWNRAMRKLGYTEVADAD